MTEKLKPCPFCGGINVIHSGYRMYCHACGAEGPDADNMDESAATEAWNRRAQPAQAGAEPVAWQGGEGWESLAWELCADENGEESCDELIWEGGPIPEPWGDRWMKYEGEAKRLIALVHKHTEPQPAQAGAEPVAWRGYTVTNGYTLHHYYGEAHRVASQIEPLYTHPPARVRMTDENIAQVRKYLAGNGIYLSNETTKALIEVAHGTKGGA